MWQAVAHPWSSVASSADGEKLVAVTFTDSYFTEMLFTSVNAGVTWTARGTSRDWSSVASSTDGTKLVATTDLGQIFASADSGATWVARADVRHWSSVASSADGSKLVAVVDGGQIYTSVAPTTETTRLCGPFGSTVQLRYIGGNQFIADDGFGALSAY